MISKIMRAKGLGLSALQATKNIQKNSFKKSGVWSNLVKAVALLIAPAVLLLTWVYNPSVDSKHAVRKQVAS